MDGPCCNGNTCMPYTSEELNNKQIMCSNGTDCKKEIFCKAGTFECPVSKLYTALLHFTRLYTALLSCLASTDLLKWKRLALVIYLDMTLSQTFRTIYHSADLLFGSVII